MSFVCENCGTRDNPAWRNTHFDPHTSTINWDDFEHLYPDLCSTLLIKRNVAAGPYMYQRVAARAAHGRTPGAYVLRGTIEEFKARGGTLKMPSNYKDKPGSRERARRHVEMLEKLGYYKPRPLHPKEKISNYGGSKS